MATAVRAANELPATSYSYQLPATSYQHELLSLVDVRRARENHRVAAIDLHFDRVVALRAGRRLAHLELVVAGERALQAIDGQLREVVRRRVEAAGVAGRDGHAGGKRVVVGLGGVDGEDA